MRAAQSPLNVSIPDEPLVLDGRSGAARAGLRQPAEQRGQVLRRRRADRDRSRGAKEARPSIAISDSGDGIEPEQLPKLFQIFMRGERSARRNQSGLGIGLALVHRLTEMHGGRVEAKSEGAGKGSCFSVRLPLNVRAACRSRARRAARFETIPPLRILVIDDNRDAAAKSGDAPGTPGAEVRVAHDGAQRAHGVRAVPTARGPARHRHAGYGRLRGRASAADVARPDRVRIVALTGWGQDEDRRRVREAGFDHHLVKPVDLASLQTLLTSVARARSRKAESA